MIAKVVHVQLRRVVSVGQHDEVCFMEWEDVVFVLAC